MIAIGASVGPRSKGWWLGPLLTIAWSSACGSPATSVPTTPPAVTIAAAPFPPTPPASEPSQPTPTEPAPSSAAGTWEFDAEALVRYLKEGTADLPPDQRRMVYGWHDSLKCMSGTMILEDDGTARITPVGCVDTPDQVLESYEAIWKQDGRSVTLIADEGDGECELVDDRLLCPEVDMFWKRVEPEPAQQSPQPSSDP